MASFRPSFQTLGLVVLGSLPEAVGRCGLGPNVVGAEVLTLSLCCTTLLNWYRSERMLVHAVLLRLHRLQYLPILVC